MTSASRTPEQKVCPVTGEKLGSHGPAVPVEVATRTTGLLWWRRAEKTSIYVCCPACAAQVRSQPGTYLVKVIAERSGWQK